MPSLVFVGVSVVSLELLLVVPVSPTFSLPSLCASHGLTTDDQISRIPCEEVARCIWKDPSIRKLSLPAAHLYCSLRHSDRCVADTYCILLQLFAYPCHHPGAALCVFLGPDGGPREGAIRLPPEKITTDAAHPTIPEEESLPSSPIATVPRKGSLYEGLRKASRTFSGVFASRVPDPSSPQPVQLSQSPSAVRPFPRTSRADGHAYGYGDGRRAFSFRSRLGSNMSGLSYRGGTQSVFRRRASNMTAITGEGVPRSFADSELSFAQRLLMANENAVTNIADLWVAAAMNVDNEEVFENDDAELEEPYESVFDADGDETNDTPNPPSGIEDTASERGKRFMGSIAPSVPSTRRGSYASPLRRPSVPQYQVSQSPQRRRPSTQYAASGQPTEMVSPPRRFSNAVPTIFAHPGVKTPPAVAEAQRLLNLPDPTQLQEGTADTMPTVEGKQPGIMSQLPMAIIFQYGWLALHTTTHDMLFLTYVVS